MKIDLAGALLGRNRARIEASLPLGRVGRPEEIAGPVVLLCSEAASCITGEVLDINGVAVLCG